jgi:hypothetical protein
LDELGNSRPVFTFEDVVRIQMKPISIPIDRDQCLCCEDELVAAYTQVKSKEGRLSLLKPPKKVCEMFQTHATRKIISGVYP